MNSRNRSSSDFHHPIKKNISEKLSIPLLPLYAIWKTRKCVILITVLNFKLSIEAVVGTCSTIYMFLKISHNSFGKHLCRSLFLIRLQVSSRLSEDFRATASVSIIAKFDFFILANFVMVIFVSSLYYNFLYLKLENIKIGVLCVTSHLLFKKTVSLEILVTQIISEVNCSSDFSTISII